jgi:diphthamide synthase (EF-2-diphthine--ammonia ligase)
MSKEHLLRAYHSAGFLVTDLKAAANETDKPHVGKRLAEMAAEVYSLEKQLIRWRNQK